MSAFANAPAYKALMITCSAATVFSFYSHSRMFSSSMFDFFRTNLVCASPTHLFITSLLLFNLKSVERILSTPKFVSLSLFSSFWTWTAVSLLRRFGVVVGFAGPVPVIFASAYYYYSVLPAVYPTASSWVSQKTFPYFFLMQLAYEAPIPALLSVLSAIVFEFTPIKRIRAPLAVQTLFYRFVRPALGTDLVGLTVGAPVAFQPTPEQVSLLTAMGFPQEQADLALRRFRGDLERSTEWLLTNS